MDEIETPEVTHHALPARRLRVGDRIIQGRQVSTVEAVHLAPKGHRDGIRVTTTRDGFTGSMIYSPRVTFDVARVVPTRCDGEGVECTVEAHQHTTTIDVETGAQLAEAVPMTCGDCGRPVFYDELTEDYYHDDELVGCWLFPARGAA